jgi:hypothetical protein
MLKLDNYYFCEPGEANHGDSPMDLQSYPGMNILFMVVSS